MRSGPPVCRRASAGSICPMLPVTHTRTGFTQHVVAHKGLIPPLCAAQCFLIPSLVCDTREGTGAKEGRGAEPRGKERLGPQGTAPAPRPHTFGHTPLGLPGGQPATRLSLGGRRRGAAPLPPPAPLEPGEGAPTRGGAPAPTSASTPTSGGEGGRLCPGWSKMRLSLGLFRGIPGWLFQNASESRRNRGNRPETVELRRILDHRAPTPPKHGETQTHFGPLRHPDGDPPHHRDDGDRNRPVPSERALPLLRRSCSRLRPARRGRAGPPPRTHRCASRAPPAARGFSGRVIRARVRQFSAAPRANGFQAGRARTTPP